MHIKCIIDFLAKIRTWWYTENVPPFFFAKNHPMKLPFWNATPTHKKKRADSAPSGTPLFRSRSSVRLNPFALSDMGFNMDDLFAAGSFSHINYDLALTNTRSTPCSDRLSPFLLALRIKYGAWLICRQLHPVTNFMPISKHRSI